MLGSYNGNVCQLGTRSPVEVAILMKAPVPAPPRLQLLSTCNNATPLCSESVVVAASSPYDLIAIAHS